MAREEVTRPLELMAGLHVVSLPLVDPPIPDSGGRIITGAGEMARVWNGDSFRFLLYLEFRADPTAPRGNHYHRKKSESLYLIQGSLAAKYENVETGEMCSITLTAGDLVTVPAGVAHSYTALESSQALEVSSEIYDSHDTHPHSLGDR